MLLHITLPNTPISRKITTWRQEIINVESQRGNVEIGNNTCGITTWKQEIIHVE